jgi:hypothetical protein
VRRRQPTLSGCDEILEIDFFKSYRNIPIGKKKSKIYTCRPRLGRRDLFVDPVGQTMGHCLGDRWTPHQFSFFEFSTSKIENSSTPRSDRLCDPFLLGFVEDFVVASSNL